MKNNSIIANNEMVNQGLVVQVRLTMRGMVIYLSSHHFPLILGIMRIVLAYT
jgi:hypothetical protein